MKKVINAVAVLCCLAMVLSMTGCFNIEIRVPTGSQNVTTTVGYQDYTTSGYADVTTVPAQEYTTIPSNTATTAPSTTAPSTTAPSSAKPSSSGKTPDQMDTEELIEYFNTCLNKIKTNKVGFTKSKLTSVLDLKLSNSAANALVSFVKGALLSETTDVTEVAKGSDSVNIMSPSGSTFVSNVFIGDLEGITCEKSGSDYIITAKVISQTNPEKNSGVMANIFDFITVDDVVSIYAPKVGATVERQNISVVFDGCYAKVTLDSKGNVKNYETYVQGVMNMYDASIKKGITINTDVAISLASKTAYTDFKY